MIVLYRLPNATTDETLKQKRFIIEYNGIYVTFSVSLKQEKVVSVCVDTRCFNRDKELVSPTDVFFDETILKYLRYLLEFNKHFVYYNNFSIVTSPKATYTELIGEIKEVLSGG